MPEIKNASLLTDLNLNDVFFDECCNSVVIAATAQPIWENQKTVSMHELSYSLRSVPSYMHVEFKPKQGFKLKRYSSVNGYLIDLHGLSTAEDHLRKNFNKKTRGNVMRVIRRLEHSFPITYKRYYGDIDKETCQHLTARLKEMIECRFDERNEESHTLKIWKQIQASLYEQIQKRKASLFVIYQGSEPLAISIAYHYNKLFFYYITSYDTDYSKFSPGIIVMYKQLEWSITNGYTHFDMGHGDLDYKRRWSTEVYTMYRYIYHPASIAHRFQAWVQGHGTEFMAFLIEKEVNRHYKKFKNLFSSNSSPHADAKQYTFTDSRADAVSLEGFRQIEVPPQLRSVMLDYIYAHQEYQDDVELLTSDDSGELYIRGKKGLKKVVAIS